MLQFRRLSTTGPFRRPEIQLRNFSVTPNVARGSYEKPRKKFDAPAQDRRSRITIRRSQQPYEPQTIRPPAPLHGVRARMEVMEEKMLQHRENATAVDVPNSERLAGRPTAVSENEDIDGESDVYTALQDGVAGYKRINRGDMCELRSPDGTSCLGLYIRDSPGTSMSEFLITTGAINRLQSARVAYYVPGFVPAEKIDAFLQYYEKVEQFQSLQGKTDTDSIILSAQHYGPLVKGVREFQRKAREIQSANANRLRELYSKFAHKTETTRLTTQRAAQELFGDEVTNEHIYATHMALMSDGLRYVGDKGYHRITSNFRVRSLSECDIIDKCTKWVRESAAKFDEQGKSTTGAIGPMATFIEKAVKVIDRFRELKEERIAKGNNQPIEPIHLQEYSWTQEDWNFIKFCIARLKSYGLQRTPVEGLIPFVLRQTKRYNDRALDATCVYDFLHEIGAFSPWENFVLHQENQEIPHFGASVKSNWNQERFDEIKNKSIAELGLTDSLKSIRKDWGQMAVFCVDDAAAKEIDDGFSVEKINETQSWVHVHIANPTAFLDRDHWITNIAESRVATRYFDPYTLPMLPTPVSHSLGLAPDRPVLTFSTKIDHTNGEILDIDITPGTVHNVKSMTYKQLGSILNIESEPQISYTFGNMQKTPEPPLPSLSPADHETLEHINLCYRALRKRRTRNGGVSVQTVGSETSVSQEVNKYLAPDLSPDYPTLFRGFPAASYTVDLVPRNSGPNHIIAEMMILANSSAALYATKHNIPLPFRGLEYNHRVPEVVNHFKNVILPSRNEFGISSRDIIDDIRTYMIIGYASTPTTAAPHVLLGLDTGYVKCTSPLRRFSDMIAHYQLTAHILGKRNFMMSHKALASLTANLDMKERMINFGSTESRKYWNSWALKHLLEIGTKFPRNMTMTVLEVKPWPNPSSGWVKDLGCVGKVWLPRKGLHKLEVGKKVTVDLVGAEPGDRSINFMAVE
ncbi:hypothetical protein BZA77DRAFT_271656 [Pyronema omphalodes]|nr:hypothetical protein BZA77DRAFT_271656 [Pyronema omphalodes]